MQKSTNRVGASFLNRAFCSTTLVCTLMMGALSSCNSTSKMASVPVFTPAGGAYYTSSVSVSITTASANASIYYTTDGTLPTTASAKYSGPLTVTSAENIQAIAAGSGLKTSAVSSAQYTLKAPLTISSSSYSFGQDIVQNSMVQTVATVSNASSAAETLTVSTSGDPSYSLNASQSCGSQLAAGASCALVVQYLPTTAGTQTGAVQVIVGGGGSVSVALTGTSTGAPTGSIAATTNPLVARYTITPQFDASVAVEFGSSTAYGFTTSVAATATSAAPVSLLVGGMRANTTYHMRADITYANGNTVTNPDQTFTTGALPANLTALNLTATTAAGQTPQPGIELLDPVNNGPYQPFAVDLQGNVIWYYPWTDYLSPFQIDGIKQMSNGDYIAVIGVLSSQPLQTVPAAAAVMIREFDLEGITVRQLTMADLNAKLAAANYQVVLTDFHHDITVLPNGHWLILANTLQVVNGINVLGDVVVDVDTNLNPKFVWNEFDHFDTARQPMAYPDWTHSNAITYSPTDGNFLVSMRHQNWVVKVNYKDGAGDGSVLWKLGYQGDFALVNGTSPIDWQYAQHAPAFVGNATAGTFSLILFDNGNDRIVSGTSGLCGLNGNAACYSTVPLFQINETAQTATVESRVTLPLSKYSFFAGNAEVLANNDWEYDICGIPSGSEIDEVTPDSSHALVWSLVANGNSEYRGFRLPSLYPNVQWSGVAHAMTTCQSCRSRGNNNEGSSRISRPSSGSLR